MQPAPAADPPAIPIADRRRTVAILGTVGVPARYGGFETLAENLVRHHARHPGGVELEVQCSARAYPDRPARYLDARLRYSRLDANGPQSILYDAVALVAAAWRRTDCVLLLGVSGALALPLVRLTSRTRIVTNIDGIEWRRAKWRGIARAVLRLSERAAVRWSHAVIADNAAIAEHVRRSYGAEARVIEYGGDHVGAGEPAAPDAPGAYALALCRIEPENNVGAILEAFAGSGRRLVFVGNWDHSDYARAQRARFAGVPGLELRDPVYEPAALARLRGGACAYVHGHSAGGTNPALVEMMHFGLPVLAFDCAFNRHTTEEAAAFWTDAADLRTRLDGLTAGELRANAARMAAIARRRYTWDRICRLYLDLAGGAPAEAGGR